MKSTIFFFVLFIINTAYSQENSYNLFTVNPANTNEEYKKSVDEAIIFNINNELYNSIFDQKNYKIMLTIPVSTGQNIYADLERFEILSPDAKMIEKSASGEKELDLRNVVLSYKGKITGSVNSFISISFYEGKIVGVIHYENDTYVMGALKDKNNFETGDFIIYRESKLKFKRDFKCGSDQFGVPDEIVKTIQQFKGEYKDKATTTFLVAKVAIDVDFYTYNSYQSSVVNTTAFTLALMSAVSAVYVKDENVRLVVSYLRIWTTQDPYTSGDAFQLLNQFRNEWIANQGGVERVIAHLISRRVVPNIAGIAYLDALCNTSLGYGLSIANGTLNQLPAYTYDVVLVAHEMGHNFGSPHTHNCSWIGGPIDTCTDIEGGCYSGPSHQTAGTIMSYCDITGGTVVMDFGPQPSALIRSRAENAACILPSERILLAAYPNGGETFRTLFTTRVYWGTSLTGNVNLDFTTNNGISWTPIQINVPAQQREYAWTIPYIGYTNEAKIRVLDSSNPNVGDTSDAAFRIILTYNAFNALSPPSPTRIETSPGNSEIQRFVWSSAGAHPSLRYKFKIRKIGAGGVDYSYTSDNAGADTVITIRKSFLDSIAQLIGTTGDSVRCSWKSTAYNGFDSATTSNSFLLTLIRVNVGINMISSLVPEKFNLLNNYPNPFNPSTIIKFDVAKFQNVKITIYDVSGREVINLVNKSLQPGSYQVTFDGANYASGVYYYKMETNNFVLTKKMILVK